MQKMLEKEKERMEEQIEERRIEEERRRMQMEVEEERRRIREKEEIVSSVYWLSTVSLFVCCCFREMSSV